jgi:hypothetical protein
MPSGKSDIIRSIEARAGIPDLAEYWLNGYPARN